MSQQFSMVLVFIGCSCCFLPAHAYGLQENEIKQSNSIEQSFAGNWIAVSSSTSGSIVPIQGHTFVLATDFCVENTKGEFSTGESRGRSTIFDANWIRDSTNEQKWTATLHINPDPTSGLVSRSDKTIVGFVSCWIDGESGVLVFTENKIELDVADFQLLEADSTAYRAYSIYRKSKDILARKAYAKEFLTYLSPRGQPLEGELKRFHGGWEVEVTDK